MLSQYKCKIYSSNFSCPQLMRDLTNIIKADKQPYTIEELLNQVFENKFSTDAAQITFWQRFGRYVDSLQATSQWSPPGISCCSETLCSETL